jgi:hypothetical protein
VYHAALAIWIIESGTDAFVWFPVGCAGITIAQENPVVAAAIQRASPGFSSSLTGRA